MVGRLISAKLIARLVDNLAMQHRPLEALWSVPADYSVVGGRGGGPGGAGGQGGAGGAAAKRRVAKQARVAGTLRCAACHLVTGAGLH